MLLIGEPGAGKSAVINALGRALRNQGHDVVELAVDRFSVKSLEGLSRALRLRHDLLEVLGAWDGPGPAYLLIDALDASRGGPAEAAFKRLIEAVIELKGRWAVVASIRTFDLRLGQTFRALFRGSPPDPDLQGDGFGSVRHVEIPPWSPAEFGELLSLSPRLAEVVQGAPAKLRELAMVPFNTRLLADLVAAGAVVQDFTAIDSQIALLNLYWERRIERHGVAAEVCLRAVVSEMVAHRTLRAPRLDVAASHAMAMENFSSEGVLVATDQQRSIQFRHHLLFDYIASRVFLDAAAIVSGSASFPKAGGHGLILAPAMGFLLRGLWAEDLLHAKFWRAVSQLLGSQDCDPVIRSVPARMAAELPVQADDVLAFAQAIASGEANSTAALSHVAGAVAVRLEDDPSAPLAPWVRLVLELSSNPGPVAFVLRMLGFLLISRVKDEELRRDLGTAMRGLLRYGYTLDDSRNIATPAIGFVADTIATDVAASVSLLSESLSDQRFDRFGVEELPALAQRIGPIAQADSVFAAEIYRAAYARDVTDISKRSMRTGRILNLTTTPKQHFEMARWSLGEYFPRFLADAPTDATQALLAAMWGYAQRRHPVPEEMTTEVVGGPEGDVSLRPDRSYIWAHEAHPHYAQDAEALLSKFEVLP